MTELDRRRFLQLAGGTAAFSMLPATIAKAAAIPANRRTRSIKDVEHVVVLMQENRSFDHYFGALRGVRGFGDSRPVTLPGGKSVWHQPNGAKDVLPYHPEADDLGMAFLAGLNHDWKGGHRAFNGGRYDQWIPAKTALTMAYLTREDIPFHYALADAFTICDGYYCSFIGNTDPNRYYMWTGYTGNDGAGGGPVLANDELGYGWTTYPERLEKAGISWKVYQDEGDGLDAAGSWGWTSDPYIGNYGDNSLLYFDNYRNAAPGSPLYEKARRGSKAKAGESFFDILKADVKGGRLPQVSWIAAPEAFSEHPNWPVNYGAWYIAQVLEALTADPEVWSKTALFVTYDENDGFFDHLVPPYPPSSRAQGLSTVNPGTEIYPGSAGYVAGPYGLGPRVPMLVVSPWSKGGWVCSEVLDHTSIIRFMEERFGVAEPNISPWRRAVCGDLTSAFDFKTPNDKAFAPALPKTAEVAAKAAALPGRTKPPTPAAPEAPVQATGARKSRATPYALQATAWLEPRQVQVTFANDGQAAAVFHAYDRLRLDQAPRRYTVEPGKRLEDLWNLGDDGLHDIWILGPNGFHRGFRGAGQDGPAVRATQANGRLSLSVQNTTAAQIDVVVTPKAYAPHLKPWRARLKPGASAAHDWDLAKTGGWYDLGVGVTGATGWAQRLAGRVETGRPSVSDPAMGGPALMTQG